ncbi:prolyl hydroxylase family protein [Thiothrix lacustris]|uniref:prolyl hydroxylase family protein n=1 Tax=Thiothrix lacustris TaxID=525917 RepID=UPI0006877F8C|nr:2OG-Fe(II) oxygenase [Thiothrix lacustris]
MFTIKDQEWQDWLDTNLSRKVSPNDLYKKMRENGFDAETLQQMMGSAYPKGIETQPIQANTNIDYQTLSQVMEARGAALGAQRLNTDIIQLYTLDNFFTVAECERVIALTAENLAPSQVSHDDGDKTFRTSMTCHLRKSDDPFVDYIDEKIARTLGICLPYSEDIQAQRYALGKELKAHHDYFVKDAPEHYAFTSQKGQRTWTFMIYLNDVAKGGGTHFPYLDYTLYPKQGQAVIWNNIYPDGLPNRHTLHQGMPVEEGEKIIITKWFRDQGEGDLFYEQMTN